MDENGGQQSRKRDVVQYWVSLGAIILSLATLIFWIGVDHQRIIALEQQQIIQDQAIRDLNNNGTAGTHQRLDDLQRELDRLTDLTLEDMGRPPVKRNR